MSREWIEEELATADLGDQRLNDRFTEVLAALSERPNVSIPAACGGHAETIAAYRFFDNEKATFEKILQPHYEKTQQRIGAQNVVLFVQDSSTIDLTKPEQQVRGAGPIGDGKNRRGATLHLLESFTPDGTPLGAVWSKMIIREEKTEEEASRTRREKKQARRVKLKRPIEQKESYRWVEGYHETNTVAKQHPQTTCVCIGDSESDLFEIFAEPREENAHILVRAYHDRCTEDEHDGPAHLRAAVSQEPVIGTSTVFVSEVQPPEGEEPIEWILLTTLPIASFEEMINPTAQRICPRTTQKARKRGKKMLFTGLAVKIGPFGESSVSPR